MISIFAFLVKYIILGFTIFNILVLLTNNFIIKNIIKKMPQIEPIKYPAISILVPARNERKNIKKCIQSLLEQDYENYELLVLDDNSTDETLKILNNTPDENNKLKIIQGKPLPKDWLGKNWTCKQLSEEAKGEYLLFTDADTTHKKNMLL
jgi:chlorobactene glucosyltransferase